MKRRSGEPRVSVSPLGTALSALREARSVPDTNRYGQASDPGAVLEETRRILDRALGQLQTASRGGDAEEFKAIQAAKGGWYVSGGGGGLIEFQGCARRDGKPFVVTIVRGKEFGQLTPSEAMNMGIRAIQAAVEAERDAAAVLGLKNAGFGDPEAARFLAMVRDHRGQVDPDPRSDHHGPGAHS